MTFDILISKAQSLVERKNYKGAIELYLKAKNVEKNNKQLFYNLGVCYLYIDEEDLAIEYLKTALIIDNEYANAHANIAIAYKRQEKYSKALSHLLRAQKQKEYDEDILYNLANIYMAMEEYNATYTICEKLLKKNPNNHKVYYTLGIMYNHLFDFGKAEQYFLKTLTLNKNYPDAQLALSMIQLRQRDYRNGWINYEARWQATNPLKPLEYPIPKYNGQDLSDKTILIQEEQGLGDNIQFIRYLQYIKEKKPKKIYVAVRKPLYRLFQCIDGIEVVSDKTMLYNVDYVLSLLSAPRIFQTTFETIFQTTPYLPSINQKLDVILEQKLNTERLKIGFAYRGNPEHKNDCYRSIPLEVFSRLFEDKDIDFFSLQVEYKSKKTKKIFAQYANVFDCSDYLDDFYDSANVIKYFDYIISIDSALVHFAGAYNIPTVLLLSQNGEWRWFDDIDYSPWYPSIKILRQKRLGIWWEVIERCSVFLNDKKT